MIARGISLRKIARKVFAQEGSRSRSVCVLICAKRKDDGLRREVLSERVLGVACAKTTEKLDCAGRCSQV